MDKNIAKNICISLFYGSSVNVHICVRMCLRMCVHGSIVILVYVCMYANWCNNNHFIAYCNTYSLPFYTKNIWVVLLVDVPFNSFSSFSGLKESFILTLKSHALSCEKCKTWLFTEVLASVPTVSCAYRCLDQ